MIGCKHPTNQRQMDKLSNKLNLQVQQRHATPTFGIPDGLGAAGLLNAEGMGAGVTLGSAGLGSATGFLNRCRT